MNSNNLGNPVAGDTAELVDSDGGLGVKYRLRQCCCGSKGRLLITLLVLLLLAGAVAAVAYILITKSHSSPTATPTPPPTPHGKICNTTRCFNISQDISSQLDEGGDPCTDFYSYTCAGFFKRHHLGPKQSKESAFTILNDDNLKVLQDALQNAYFNYPQSTSISKTATIYNSCLNTIAINNRGKKPLEDLIEKYGGWSVTGKGLNSWTIQEKMGRIVRDLNVQTLLSVSVMTDYEDSSNHILRIGSSLLGMSQDHYADYEIGLAYKTYMKTIARLLGGGYFSELRMMAIYNFEADLAGTTIGKSYTDDVVELLRQYHRSGRSLDSLDKTIWNFCLETNFDESFILQFLNTAFSYQFSFTSSEKVFYGGSSVFKDIVAKYQSTSSTTVKDYIMWRVVDYFVMSMPQQFVQAKLKFAEAVAGVQKYERWSHCIENMMTPMDMTLGRLFVDARFDEATKQTVTDMTTRLRKAFINNLYSANWMDDTTRQAAKEKANAIKEDVGYPLYIKDDSKLDTHYDMLTVSGDYFENTVAMNKMLIQRHLGVLRQPVNKDLWADSPAQINGYYSPQQNRIVFLAGILQSPFYKKNYPKYINYGSLAMVIGHEITHGFDSTGRLFDKNGNVKDWWSYDSAENFKSRSECLVEQYNGYEVFGKYIDGKQTLNENIADNGGIKLAYEAYQSWVRDNEQEERLPDLGFNVDQLFFIGFALPWCSIYTKEAALYQLKTDEHSYNKYRVIGPLSNFDKFSQAFSCPYGSKMNPYRKCSVW